MRSQSGVLTLVSKPDYSGDPKTGHLNTGSIWKPDIFKVGFLMVQFSNGLDHSKVISLVLAILTPNFWLFKTIFYTFFFIFLYKTVQASNLSKFLPFWNKPTFDRSKSGHIWFSDPHCTYLEHRWHSKVMVNSGFMSWMCYTHCLLSLSS